MKRLLTLSLLLLSTLSLYAQETFRAMYDTHCTFKVGLSVFEERNGITDQVVTYPCALEISPDRTYFYNYTQMVKDSTAHAVYAQTQDLMKAFTEAKAIKAQGAHMIVDSSPQSLIHKVGHSILNNFYFFQEEMTRPEWVIDETTTEERCGYKCHRATAKYLGRLWTAWYTPEIPTSAGPWKLWGLPGLIVSAQDESGRYAFDMTSFSKIAPESLKGDITEYLHRGEVFTESKPKVLKLLESYVSNPMAFMSMQNPNRKISIGYADGSATSNADFTANFEYIEVQ